MKFRNLFGLVLISTLLNGCESSDDSSSRISPPIKEGGPFPEFHLSQLDGSSFSSGQFRGKLTLVNLWATWCPPCISEMPALERLYQLLGHENFQIVAVSGDSKSGKNDVLRFVDRNGLSFPILLDPDNTLIRALGAQGFPESFFVNAEGRVIAVLDPEKGRKNIRVVSDRSWDSDSWIAVVRALLQEQLLPPNPAK